MSSEPLPPIVLTGVVPPRRFVTAEATHLAADVENLYWSSGRSIWTSPLAEPARPKKVATFEMEVHALAAREGIVWVGIGSGEPCGMAGLDRCSKGAVARVVAATGVSKIVLRSPDRDISGIDVKVDGVLVEQSSYTDILGQDLHWVVLDRSGNVVPEDASSSAAEPAGVTIDGHSASSDGSHLYWCDRDSVKRVAQRPGARAEIVVKTNGWPRDLVLTQSALFWLIAQSEEKEEGPYAIMTMPKPAAR